MRWCFPAVRRQISKMGRGATKKKSTPKAMKVVNACRAMSHENKHNFAFAFTVYALIAYRIHHAYETIICVASTW